MSDIGIIRAGAHALTHLEVSGYTVGEIRDPRSVPVVLDGLGKKWFSRYLSSVYNDLTSENSLWITVSQGTEVVACLGARHDRIPRRGLNSFWANQQIRMYKSAIDESHAPPIVDDIFGHVVQLGDLFIKNGALGSTKKYIPSLSSLVILTYIAAYQKWSAPDWYYAILSERHARQGQWFNFRMPHVYSSAHRWLSEPPFNRQDSDCLAAMSSMDFQFMIADYLGRLQELGEVQDELLPRRAFNRQNEAIIKHSKNTIAG